MQAAAAALATAVPAAYGLYVWKTRTSSRSSAGEKLTRLLLLLSGALPSPNTCGRGEQQPTCSQRKLILRLTTRATVDQLLGAYMQCVRCMC
jgi:hypothetical protein